MAEGSCVSETPWPFTLAIHPRRRRPYDVRLGADEVHVLAHRRFETRQVQLVTHHQVLVTTTLAMVPNDQVSTTLPPCCSRQPELHLQVTNADGAHQRRVVVQHGQPAHVLPRPSRQCSTTACRLAPAVAARARPTAGACTWANMSWKAWLSVSDAATETTLSRDAVQSTGTTCAAALTAMKTAPSGDRSPRLRSRARRGCAPGPAAAARWGPACWHSW